VALYELHPGTCELLERLELRRVDLVADVTGDHDDAACHVVDREPLLAASFAPAG
jgi:hypothetical protein